MQGHPTRRQVIAQASGAQRTEGELYIVTNRGRMRAAEGINRHVIIRR